VDTGWEVPVGIEVRNHNTMISLCCDGIALATGPRNDPFDYHREVADKSGSSPRYFVNLRPSFGAVVFVGVGLGAATVSGPYLC
jgi:hypothetical protein